MAIARGEHKRRPGDPKVWFSSIESFARVLSDRNRELLGVIAETKPQSLNELAGRITSSSAPTPRLPRRTPSFPALH